MKRRWVCLAIAMAFAIPRICRAEGARFERCKSIGAITRAIAILEKSDFKSISWARVQAIWPTKLEPYNCTAQGCRSMFYQELIIDGLCECCQKIDIDRPSDPTAPSDESVVVTIYYSARSKTDVVAAARALAKAAGLSDDQVRTVGREPDQSFQWQGVSQGEMFIMAVKLTRHEAHWTVFVHVDRHLMPVPAAKPGAVSH